MPLRAVAWLEGDHAGVHTVPLFAEGIGEVELMLDCDEVLCGWGVGLDGLDFRRQALDANSIFRGFVENIDGGGAIFPVELAPVVVVEVLVERLALAEIELA